jgi:HSP20 family protein
LVDVNTTDKEVKVVLEMPGVKKEDIKINAFDGSVDVIANNPQRKYHKTVELPQDADIETVKSTYNNGILEITFNKKENIKPKGKEIKIE